MTSDRRATLSRVMPSTTDSLVQTIITLQAERDRLAAELDTLQSKWNRVIEAVDAGRLGRPEVGRHGKDM